MVRFHDEEPLLEYIMHSNVPGWFSDGDIAAITKIAEQLPDQGVLVELGVGFGRSTTIWAELFRKMNKSYTIIGVDKFQHVPIEINYVHEHISPIDGDRTLLTPFLNGKQTQYDVAKRMTQDYPEIQLVKHDLETDEPFIRDVQCIFEDSKHTPDAYNHVIRNWYNKLDRNGIFCGHDYSRELFPDLVDAIDVYADIHDLEIVTYPDSVVYSYIGN